MEVAGYLRSRRVFLILICASVVIALIVGFRGLVARSDSNDGAAVGVLRAYVCAQDEHFRDKTSYATVSDLVRLGYLDEMWREHLRGVENAMEVRESDNYLFTFNLSDSAHFTATADPVVDSQLLRIKGLNRHYFTDQSFALRHNLHRRATESDELLLPSLLNEE